MKCSCIDALAKSAENFNLCTDGSTGRKNDEKIENEISKATA